jgi:hypothetical protein
LLLPAVPGENCRRLLDKQEFLVRGHGCSPTRCPARRHRRTGERVVSSGAPLQMGAAA